jgi:transposase
VIILKPISNDKRLNIIEAKQRKESVENIIKWFNVSASSISRIWNKYLKTGDYSAIPYTGRKSDISKEKEDEIREYIRNHNDATLEEMIEALSINLTVSGLSRHLDKMDLSYKKRRSTLKTNNERMLSSPEKNGRKTKST